MNKLAIDPAILVNLCKKVALPPKVDTEKQLHHCFEKCKVTLSRVDPNVDVDGIAESGEMVNQVRDNEPQHHLSALKKESRRLYRCSDELLATSEILITEHRKMMRQLERMGMPKRQGNNKSVSDVRPEFLDRYRELTRRIYWEMLQQEKQLHTLKKVASLVLFENRLLQSLFEAERKKVYQGMEDAFDEIDVDSLVNLAFEALFGVEVDGSTQEEQNTTIIRNGPTTATSRTDSSLVDTVVEKGLQENGA